MNRPPLEQYDKICGAASEGKWRVDKDVPYVVTIGKIDAFGVENPDDAKFIAAARTGWPATIAWARELEAELKRTDKLLSAANDDAKKWFDHAEIQDAEIKRLYKVNDELKRQMHGMKCCENCAKPCHMIPTGGNELDMYHNYKKCREYGYNHWQPKGEGDA